VAHDAALYAGILEARAASAPEVVADLWGFDRDEEMLGLSGRNAERAGVSAYMTWEARAASALEPPTEQPGVVIANPPYGKRLTRSGGRRSADRVLLDRFAEKFEGWVLGLLLPSDHQPEHPALAIEEVARFRNGGTAVRFWRAVHGPKS